MTDQTSSKGSCKASAGGCAGACGGPSPMPEVTFSAFIISLASAALVGLGEVADPATGTVSRDLLLARATTSMCWKCCAKRLRAA